MYSESERKATKMQADYINEGVCFMPPPQRSLL